MIFQDKKNDAKKDETKKDETKKEEAKKDETKKDETKKDETKKDETKKDETTAAAPPAGGAKTGTQMPAKEPSFFDNLAANWSPIALTFGAIVLVYFLYRYFLAKPGEQKS
jgi:hypothetical protein